MAAGKVIEIFITGAAGEPMIARSEAEAVPGSGLAGDRYALGAGFYSDKPTTAGARELTLIDERAIAQFSELTGLPFASIESRRNLITRGVDLDALIGKAFSIGDVVCEGVRTCPPCVHLEELTSKKVMRALARTGGLRARIVQGGTIRVGDEIEALGPASGKSVRNLK